MGTRSDIIAERQDGTWARIYCHFDGYLNGVGRTLIEHYNSQERAEAVVQHGDMSVLAEKCDKPEGHSYDTRVAGYSVYYGRDRGEEHTEAKIGKSLAEVWPDGDTGTEYTYVWRMDHEADEFVGGWYVGDADEGSETLVRLEDALAGIVPEPLPNVKAFGGNFVIGKRKPTGSDA